MRPPNPDCVLVGYENIAKYPYDGRPFHRRIWWLTPGDRDYDPSGVYEHGSPCETVVSDSVGVGVESKQFSETWGREAGRT